MLGLHKFWTSMDINLTPCGGFNFKCHLAVLRPNVFNFRNYACGVLDTKYRGIWPQSLGRFQILKKRRGCATYNGTTPVLDRVIPNQLVAVGSADSGHAAHING